MESDIDLRIQSVYFQNLLVRVTELKRTRFGLIWKSQGITLMVCTTDEQFVAYYANRTAEEDEGVVVELLVEPKFKQYVTLKQRRVAMLLRILR